MGLALFENYSATTENKKKKKLQPIKIRLSQEKAFAVVESYFDSLSPLDKIIAKDFFDICILDKKHFEISVQLIFSNGTTFVNASVYGRNKRGKTRKRLYKLLNDLNQIFDKYK